MICKFTTTSFEQDFSGSQLNIVEENHWFNDQFFTKYTFPTEFDISDELDLALNMITHNNSARSPKKFDGYLQIFGKETEAVLIIERMQGKKAQGKLRYGFEEFPNFNKRLSELPLERFKLTESITSFALGRLDQTYPAVNYNFPQVIVDEIDTSTEQWQYFEGIINNFRAGVFVENEYNSTTAEQINRNIMQPMPYLLYVIAAGFADAGLELRGDILTDPEFQDAVITLLSDYYRTASGEAMEMFLQCNGYNYLETIRAWSGSRFYDREVGHYSYSVILPAPGVYKIAGNVILRTDGFKATASINVNGTNTIWEGEKAYIRYREEFFSIDRNVEVSVEQGSVSINFISYQLPYAQIDQNQDPEAMILDLTITQIAGYDQDGNLVPTLVTPEEINLQKCVPDMTFGDLIKGVKNWKNYDVNPGDGYVEMNKISNEMKKGVVVDLSLKEVYEPIRSFYQDSTFLLQFQEINSEEYKFDKVFIDSSGSRSSSYTKRDDTSEITINGFPLPLKQKGAVYTGHLFTDAKSTLALTIYPGLLNGLNLCRDTSRLLIPKVYESDWKIWIDFRINAEGFEWTFGADPLLAALITRKSEIHAYGRKFIVRRVSKKNTSRKYWEVTLECDGDQ